MATKYQQIFKEMLEQNAAQFEAFQAIHDQYDLNPQANQAKFNQIGDPILEIIQDYENRLCKKSEKSGYGAYSSKLSEKFWDHVRKIYPHIDSVGLTAAKS